MSANEKNRVFDLLREGKIDVDEAQRLLDALDTPAPPPQPLTLTAPRSKKGRKLRILVDYNDGSDKAKVNLSIPLGVVKVLGPAIATNLPKTAADKMHEHGIDLSALIASLDDLLDADLDGEDLINVDAEGALVRIYVE